MLNGMRLNFWVKIKFDKKIIFVYIFNSQEGANMSYFTDENLYQHTRIDYFSCNKNGKICWEGAEKGYFSGEQLSSR